MNEFPSLERKLIPEESELKKGKREAWKALFFHSLNEDEGPAQEVHRYLQVLQRQ